jgi:hypothetical protein
MSSSEAASRGENVVAPPLAGSSNRPVPEFTAEQSEAIRRTFGARVLPRRVSIDDGSGPANGEDIDLSTAVAEQAVPPPMVAIDTGCDRADLRPARGIMIAILLSVIVWALVALAL